MPLLNFLQSADDEHDPEYLAFYTTTREQLEQFDREQGFGVGEQNYADYLRDKGRI